MRAPTITLKLNLEDLHFIDDSINANVPNDTHRTQEETVTSDLIRSALAKLGKRK
ncbi:hypothetical protein BD1_33 [Octadecabacter Antarctic BD virus 1]|nr:hypothetical protein BD1_33 [Octadecabacter Antarctic BD virus 1]